MVEKWNNCLTTFKKKTTKPNRKYECTSGQIYYSEIKKKQQQYEWCNKSMPTNSKIVAVSEYTHTVSSRFTTVEELTLHMYTA